MKAQFITTEGGEELVVLPRRLYDELAKGVRLNEDAGTAQVVDRSKAQMDAGYEIAIPSAIAEAIAGGGNEIRAVREWRGLTQAQLAKKTGLTQGYVSQLENGASEGTPKALRAIANALAVPVDLVIPG